MNCYDYFFYIQYQIKLHFLLLLNLTTYFYRLKQLQEAMVGGEKSQDKELKAKRQKRKKNTEMRHAILSEALKNVDDEDGIMLKVYDDIHEELKAKSEVAKRQKLKVNIIA